MRSAWTSLACAFTESSFDHVDPVFWDLGDPYPSLVDFWEGDWILSFRGDFIVPEATLGRASKGSLNFHPAPPRYRGIGSHHYAIHNGDSDFGVTCHHMAQEVDAGAIIRVDNFPISAGETATSLGFRAGAHCLTQFVDIVAQHVIGGAALPVAHAEWGDRLYTHAGLAAWKLRVMTDDPEHRSVR